MRPYWAFLLVLACAPPNAATPYPKTTPPDPPKAVEPAAPVATPTPGTAHYFDRAIDLQPFLAGFPYGEFQPDLEAGRLFYLELGDRYTLRSVDINEPLRSWQLDSGTALSDADWSKRSLWGLHYHPQSRSLWLHADAANDEVMNLWRLDLQTRALDQVTHDDYIYGFGFTDDNSTVAYLPRQGKSAPYRTCLRVRDVATGSEKTPVCDSPRLAFTWSDVRFSPDRHQQLFLVAQIDGDRNRKQLVSVDTRTPAARIRMLTEPKAARSELQILRGWHNDELFYVANDDGYANLHAWSKATGNARQVTKFTEDIGSAFLTAHGLLAVHQTPAGATLVLVDPATGTVKAQQAMPGTVKIEDAEGTRALVTQRSPDILFEAFEVTVQANAFELHPAAAPTPELQQSAVACRATAVKIPTFDKDPTTGQQRLLHAFLLEPRAQLPDPNQRLAMITAFYGGENRYSQFDQIMCAAGFTVLSPAVRGSTGFGRDFHALNDKDLGGKEIVDLFWAAKWLEQRTGLNSRRIGVYGGSHGGYATMRALTFSPVSGANTAPYLFGFGMAHAGFSDIKTFFDATNIPDWVVLESGDPNKPDELARMKDRSPLQHADRLQMPLLLTHGSQDWRVPVNESRQFAKAAKALNRPVNYVEFEGQGHHIEGLGLQVKLYQTRFDFLRAVAAAATEDGL